MYMRMKIPTVDDARSKQSHLKYTMVIPPLKILRLSILKTEIVSSQHIIYILTYMDTVNNQHQLV